MLESLIFFAGVGQLVLVLCSLAIPKILNWRDEISKLRPLTRQVFWTYAGYIWVTNLSFALVSLISPASLTDRSFLATAVTIYIFAYWLARVIIQFTWFDRSDAPKGLRYSIAEGLLVGLFIGLTVIYGWAVIENLNGAVV
jgi:hypothetical protein